eukprot:PhF_6_TR3735/c0_g1_i3/m.5368
MLSPYILQRPKSQSKSSPSFRGHVQTTPSSIPTTPEPATQFRPESTPTTSELAHNTPREGFSASTSSSSSLAIPHKAMILRLESDQYMSRRALEECEALGMDLIFSTWYEAVQRQWIQEDYERWMFLFEDQNERLKIFAKRGTNLMWLEHAGRVLSIYQRKTGLLMREERSGWNWIIKEWSTSPCTRKYMNEWKSMIVNNHQSARSGFGQGFLMSLQRHVEWETTVRGAIHVYEEEERDV